MMTKHSTTADYLAALAEPLRTVAQKAAEVIEAAVPEASGAIWHGHPVWSLGDAPGRNPLCLLKAYPNHVTFGLWHGQSVSDASGRLEPGARDMAHVKLRSSADVDPELFTSWLRQVLEAEGRR
jgi:hypothetical protein